MSSTVEAFAEMIAAALRPLLTVVDGDDGDILTFVEELGWILPVPPPPAFAALADTVAAAAFSNDALDDARAEASEGTATDAAVMEASAQLVLDLGTLAAEVERLPDLLRAQLPAEYLAATQIDRDILRRLYDHLITDAIERSAFRAYTVMCLAGLIEATVEGEDLDRHQPEFRWRRLRWDRVPELLDHPGSVLRDVYGWGTPTIDGDCLFEALLPLSISIKAPACLQYPSDQFLAVAAPDAHSPFEDATRGILFPFLDLESVKLSLAITPLPMATPSSPQSLAFSLRATGLADVTIPLFPGATMDLRAGVDLAPGFGVVLRPGAAATAFTSLDAGVAFDAGRASARLRYARRESLQLLSLFDVVRLEADELFLGCGVEASSAGVDPFVEAGLHGGKLVVGRGPMDGFIGALLPEGGLEVGFDLAAGWSTRRGLYLEGSAGLDTTISMQRSLGPFRVESMHAAIATDGDRLHAELTASGRATLGPVVVMVERIGLAVDVAFEPGNLGPVDLDVGFRPPTGAGILVNAGPITGGGVLTLDPAAGRYAGAVQLDAFGLALSALGVVDTKLPDGTKGFSFVAIVSAEFAPVQLGLGFTLNGVGGLVAINRRVDIDALRNALYSGGMADILFPEDVVAQASRMVGDLARYFPMAKGRYVFGPAVKIGWGTPTIVEGELAILLEVPAAVRIVLLGNVRTALPTKERPIIELNVDVVGEVDFAKKTVAVDASLRDSKVAGFALTGDMAFRMSWGDAPSFVLSVGGFHSQFRTPPGFPELRRVRISIGADEDPRLDIQGFLALTSNTLQVGAQVDLYASAGPLNVMGTLGFETLIQFSPFSFQVDLWAGVALRRNSTVLASVHLDGRLTGPSPWRIVGQACLSLWFVDLCVDFDATFGRAEAAELPRREIWPELEAALVMPESWSTALPPAGAQVVVTAPPVGEGPAVRIDPAAALTVRQKVVPLNRTITRFAQAEPEGAGRFDVTQVKVGTAGVPFQPVTDWFAPAQFEALSDAERLSRDGYEPMVAGVTVASDAVSTGPVLTKALGYETILLRGGERVPMPGEHRPTRSAQIASTALGANANAPLRRHAAGAPPRVRLDEEQYVITSTMDLSPRLDIVGKVSRGEAELALKAYVMRHPVAHGDLQVVPLFEVEELVA